MIAFFTQDIPFITIMVGSLVGVSSALLGCFLVLRRSSMLSDAISHAILLGIMLVWLLTRQQSGPLLIAGAAGTGVLTVYLSELLVRSRRVKHDAAIGLVFPALFAAGVLLTNLFARNVHIDAHTVLLGEIGFAWLDTTPILGVEVPQAYLSMGGLALINLIFVAVLFKELKLATFDPALASALGFVPVVLHYLLLTLTSATAVAAFDAVGAILLIAFVVVPASAAYLLTDRLWRMLVLSSLFAVASSVSGYYLAVAFDVSISGMMATMTGVFLLVAFLAGPRYGLVAQEVRRLRQRRTNASRALVVHLYHHENSRRVSSENAVAALHEHLGWSGRKVQQVLLRCLDQGLIRRERDALFLTPTGRAVAREIYEPWSSGARGAGPSGPGARSQPP